MARYLMRFDDINSRMDWKNFYTIKRVLEDYNIKSILGVVPRCEDKFIEVGKSEANFFDILREFSLYGDVIAQHGFKHLYESESKGLYGNTSNSEFAGLPYEKQILKLKKGKEILKRENLWRPVFMAPNHSFDYVTVKALQELGFETILDGFSLLPFSENKLNFIPQISSRPLPIYTPALSQLCIHVNTISDYNLNQLILFIKKNHKRFIKLEDIKISNNFYTFFDRKSISIFIRLFRILKKLTVFGIDIFFKSRCILQRLIYIVKFYGVDIYKWHLTGTYYCRNYKMKSLKIINSLNPDLYIDIGCGLGEILNKVSLTSKYKLGYDIDPRLVKVNNILKNKDFIFFNNEDQLLFEAKKLRSIQNQNLVLSMLGFSQHLSRDYLEKKLNKYLEIMGNYILLIDNVYVNSEEYEYDHHDFLYNHQGLFKYFHKVDKLRSLYCLQIG